MRYIWSRILSGLLVLFVLGALLNYMTYKKSCVAISLDISKMLTYTKNVENMLQARVDHIDQQTEEISCLIKMIKKRSQNYWFCWHYYLVKDHFELIPAEKRQFMEEYRLVEMEFRYFHTEIVESVEGIPSGFSSDLFCEDRFVFKNCFKIN
jgi:hypothetical protein